MAYIGNDLKVAYPSYLNIDDISGSFNGSTTSFALLVGGVAPSPLPLNSQQCLISVGGVIQRPDDTGTEGFRLSGGNIIFSSAPSTGEDFFGVILAGADYVNVGANFPDGSQSAPSITFEQDNDTGFYRSGSGLVSVSSNNTKVFTFPTTAGSNGQYLQTDGAGTATWASAGSFAAGTAMLFVQTAAPTGWTKVTTHNDKALRVVSGSASSGGSTAFTTVFASRTPAGSIANTTATGTIGATTLTTTQIPSHNHYVDGSSAIGSTFGTWAYDEKGGAIDASNSNYVKAAGGGGSHDHGFTGTAHNHTFTGTAMDFAVQYVDVIIATKD